MNTYYSNAGLQTKRSSKLFLIGAALAVGAAIAMTAIMNPASALSSTVIVTGDTSTAENQPGWMLNRDSVSDYSFTTAEHSIGSGSLFAGPISSTPADKFVAEDFINKPVADVQSVSFDFKLGTGVSTAKADQVYMNVYANFGQSDDLKFYDCRYNVLATVGTGSNWTTVTFDPTQNYDVTKRSTSPYDCPSSPAAMDGLSAGSNIRAFAINLGDSTASDAGVSAYFDKVVVAVNSDSTTYDFEPVLTPATKDDCKNGNWATFNTPAFTNQGRCVSWVSANDNSSFKREQ